MDHHAVQHRLCKQFLPGMKSIPNCSSINKSALITVTSFVQFASFFSCSTISLCDALHLIKDQYSAAAAAAVLYMQT